MDGLEGVETRRPGFFFCASYRGGVSVGDCIKSAHAMADRVRQHLDASRDARA
jgi:hypothetical protein